jgi:hypothetical protein
VTLARVLVSIAVASAVTFASVAVASATPRPTVAMLHSSGLVDGQRVHITARHEPIFRTLVAGECTGAFPADGSGDCRLIAVNDFAQDSTYKFLGKVFTGNIGVGTCGTSVTDNDCVVAVMPYNGGSHVWDTADAVTIPISFARPS